MSERLENELMLLFGDPDPRIGDGEVKDVWVGGREQADLDLAFMSELNRVAYEVGQDLAHSHLVTHAEHRHGGGEFTADADTLFQSLGCEQCVDVFRSRVQIEPGQLQFQFLSLDLRHV